MFGRHPAEVMSSFPSEKLPRENYISGVTAFIWFKSKYIQVSDFQDKLFDDPNVDVENK